MNDNHNIKKKLFLIFFILIALIPFVYANYIWDDEEEAMFYSGGVCTNPLNANNTDWTNFAIGNHCDFYFNWTKPDYASSKSQLIVKYGGSNYTFVMSNYTTCWNYNDTQVEYWFRPNQDGVDYYTTIRCRNSSTWVLMNETHGSNNNELYESAMNWFNNTNSSVTLPLLTPATAYTNTSIIANTTYTDADLDSGTIYFEWWNDTTLIYTDTKTGITNGTLVNSTLYHGNFSKNMNISVNVTANDGTTNSTLQASAKRFINNSIPYITLPLLTPATAYTNTSIIANTTYTDADLDSGTIYFEWWNDTTLIYTDTKTGITNGTLVNSTLYHGNFSKNMNISVNVTANDGTTNSTLQASAKRFINNSIPQINTIIITPTLPTISNNLNCSITFTEADSDTLTANWTRWYINNVLNQTNLNNFTLDNSFTSIDDNISCSVIVFDGTDNSTWTNSSTITLGDSTAPTISDFRLSSSSAYTDETVYAYLNCTDANLLATNFPKVSYNQTSGEIFNHTMTLDTGTRYKYQISLAVGTYSTFKAFCRDGSGNEIQNLSNSLNLTATTRPSSSPQLSGGGNVPSTEVFISEGNYTIKSDLGSSSYELLIAPNSKRTRSVIIKNYGAENLTVSVFCRGSYCPNVEFSKETLTLPPNKKFEGIVEFTITTGNDKYGTEHFFSVVVKDQKGNEGTLPVKITISRVWGTITLLLDKFKQFFEINISGIKSDAEPIKIPKALVIFFMPIIWIFITFGMSKIPIFRDAKFFIFTKQISYSIGTFLVFILTLILV